MPDGYFFSAGFSGAASADAETDWLGSVGGDAELADGEPTGPADRDAGADGEAEEDEEEDGVEEGEGGGGGTGGTDRESPASAADGRTTAGEVGVVYG